MKIKENKGCVVKATAAAAAVSSQCFRMRILLPHIYHTYVHDLCTALWGSKWIGPFLRHHRIVVFPRVKETIVLTTFSFFFFRRPFFPCK